ncbi:MAG TPA: FAD-linked oxidase C-terminal domain-containing protein [Spirochaetota bacterium]|nr:FAD-linked oxidase C-terminal domain-containing protein [Spirochaetota bacterium]
MRTKILQQLLDALKKTLPEGSVYSDSDFLAPYSTDEAPDLSASPDIVVKARDTQSVSDTLRLCSQFKVPVTTRGTGTGVTGGSVAIRGGVVLTCEGMDRILEIDRENMTCTVEPGVITGNLQRAVLEQGLMYPPDPSSLESCSIGGNVAVGAGGPRAVKYGTTRSYVLGLEFVLPDGTVMNSGGKFIKDATGYSLTGILIGSEGTLAVITKIILKLLPAPRHTLDLLVPFDSIREALDTVHDIIAGGVIPAALEFMEEDALILVGKLQGVDLPFPGAKAHLLIQLDGNSEDDIARDIQLLMAHIPSDPDRIIVAESPQQQERIWKARRSIREAITRESPVFLAEDTVVPRASIPEFLVELKQGFAERGLRSVIFGHAGDGNVHVDVLRDAMNEDAWKKICIEIKNLIYHTAVSYGGTISGEHGIGYLKKDYLPITADPAKIELYRRIKHAFDPENILNPDKIFNTPHT